MKIAFAGSRELSVRIIEWIDQNKDHFDVQLVGGVEPKFKGWWNDKVADTYKYCKIPVFSSIEEMIDIAQPEIVFSLNYWKMIPSSYIPKIKKGIVNIHHSYRLRFRGRYSTSWAIVRARKDRNWWHGTTLHYVDSKLDNGPIIASERCKITEEDTAESLYAKVEDLAFNMFKDNFKNILEGVNDHIKPDREYFYYPKDSNRNLEIDLNMPIEELYDFVRAWTFKDRPKPYFSYNRQKIYLTLNQ